MKLNSFFFKKNRTLFTYYRNSYEHLDTEIFKANSEQLELLAKIGAAEEFELYLNQRLDPSLISKKSKLQWTDKPVNFAEFAYALYCSKSLNYGKISLDYLAEELAYFFNYKLKQSVSRTWSDIKKDMLGLMFICKRWQKTYTTRKIYK